MNRESNTEEIANSGLVPQLGMMVRALWAAPVRNTLFWLSGSLFLVIAVTAYGQIRLNSWNQPFYDALSRRDFAQFLVQLGVFGLIAGTLLILNVAQRWLVETVKLKLRRGLALDLIKNWMQPGRAFRLSQAGPMGVNPDQRMHEDARHLTELSADLGVGLLQSSILLATFIKVLWSLSNNFVFHVGDRHFAVPGYMVWAAIVYSGSASLLSYWVVRQPALDGRPLVLAEQPLYAFQGDGVDVPGIARNVRYPLNTQVVRCVESVIHAGSQPECHVRAVAVTGRQLGVADEVGHGIGKPLRLQYHAIEHLAGGTDDSIARTAQHRGIRVDRPRPFLQLPCEAIVQAVKVRLARFAQIQV